MDLKNIKKTRPILINCHPGRDYYDFERGCEVIEARKAEGRAWLTINPEFGPFTYQPIDPKTGEPHADIWEVCLWITQRFRDRWNGKP